MKPDKILLTVGLLTCFLTAAFAQPPAIEWQRCYGGSSTDFGYSILQTLDGGYITAGFSNSTDGDISFNHGLEDYWIVKLQSNGAIAWQRSLGGSGGERAQCIRQTTDGGYIVAGYSLSNNGDVTGNHGGADCWIVKLSSSGAIEWQRSYGGSGLDEARSIALTQDGGYIVAGGTLSNNGDVSGNHGSEDCWVFKINATGDLIWQKCYGGSSGEIANSIQATPDGGYIMCGSTLSDDGDVGSNHGISDYWVVKLAGDGSISWQKTFGGSDADTPYQVVQTTDGGYVVAGTTNSNDYDITNFQGGSDYWVIRLNSMGEIIWEKTFGGSSQDAVKTVKQTNDGGFLIGGNTLSLDGDVTGLHGDGAGGYDPDSWIVKISPAGILEWEKTLGGGGSEASFDIAITADGGSIVTGETLSNNSGDVGPNHGSFDFWVVKLAPELLPVSLDHLEARALGSSVICTWKTLHEQNSNHFSVERSVDAIHFKEAGTVTAAGNSQVTRYYSFSDNDALAAGSEDIYYRLRLIDNDGSFSYSNIAKVKLPFATGLSVYPNPVVDELSLSFNAAATGKLIISISDVAGKKLFSQSRDVQKGRNVIPVNVSAFSNGTYIIDLSGSENYHGSFIKIKN